MKPTDRFITEEGDLEEESEVLVLKIKLLEDKSLYVVIQNETEEGGFEDGEVVEVAEGQEAFGLTYKELAKNDSKHMIVGT